MATKKKGSTGQSRGSAKHKVIKGEAPAGVVSLSEEDREYLSTGVKNARSRLGGDADESAVFEMLENFGLSSKRVERLRAAMAKLNPSDAVDKASEYFAEQIESAKDYSRENPGKVIGGAAGVLVGASLLAMALNRASGETSSRRSSSRSSRKSSTGSRKAAAKRGGASSGGSKKGSSKKSSGSSSRRSSSGRSSRGTSGSARKSGSTRKSSSTAAGSSKKSSSRGGARKSSSTKATTRSSSRAASGRGGTKKRSSSNRSSSRKSAS